MDTTLAAAPEEVHEAPSREYLQMLAPGHYRDRRNGVQYSEGRDGSLRRLPY